MADAGYALIKAAAGGSRTPVQIGEVSDADYQAFGNALAASGLSQSQIKAFSDGTIASQTDEDQCAIGKAFFHSINGLPDEQANRVMSFVVSKSV